jgi:hypothetical protein
MRTLVLICIIAAGLGFATEYSANAYLIPDPMRFGDDYVEVKAGALTFVLTGGLRPDGDVQDQFTITLEDDATKVSPEIKLPKGKMLLWVRFSNAKSLPKPLRVVLVGSEEMAGSVLAYRSEGTSPRLVEINLTRQKDQKLVTFEIEKLEPLIFMLP